MSAPTEKQQNIGSEFNTSSFRDHDIASGVPQDINPWRFFKHQRESSELLNRMLNRIASVNEHADSTSESLLPRRTEEEVTSSGLSILRTHAISGARGHGRLYGRDILLK